MNIGDELKQLGRDMVAFIWEITVKVFKGLWWVLSKLAVLLKRFFPWKMEDLFPYRFPQLFFHRPYWNDIKEVFREIEDPEKPYIRWLILLCMFSPPSAVLALAMFTYTYTKFDLMRQGYKPYLNGQPRIVYAAMLFGAMIPIYIIAAIIPVTVISGFFLGLALKLQSQWLYNTVRLVLGSIAFVIAWFTAAWLFISVLMIGMRAWRKGIISYVDETDRHGSAHFANAEDLLSAVKGDGETLETYKPKGFYIGSGFYYPKAGHLLTVAGTRAGKGTNLIIPNLIKTGQFKGSWVIVDPKGENAAITARAQKEAGRNVIILNPWHLHADKLSGVLGHEYNAPDEYPASPKRSVRAGQRYNPLDLLTDTTSANFSDDAQIIAEMIVPMKEGGSGDNKFFYDRARSIITSFIMHIVISQPEEKKNLKTLWQMLRLDKDGWTTLMATMKLSKNEIVQGTANELLSLEASEKVFSNIIATLQNSTDFLKSPALQETMASSEFKISDLSKGNTALYIIIPADKLKTHYQWLRLVVTSALRSVVRNYDKDVCFLLDEAYALDYISEVDVALGTYAGFGIHIWSIFQNLIQIKALYGENWENFVSSCSVRHFFNVSDNFSSEYLSKMFGQTSIPSYDLLGRVTGSTARYLVNPDEVRRSSGDKMFVVVDQLAPIQIPKHEYYTMPWLKEGVDYDRNPYLKDE